ncbi:MAG: peptide deformylase [Thermoanaerobaculia bacterium]
MRRPIRIYPDPVLRGKAAPVETFDAALAELAKELAATMYDAPGVGLAAPQIGELQRVAVIDVDPRGPASKLHVLINPRIVESSGESLDSEGCLSIPELTEKVERPQRVRVEAVDVEGRPFELLGEGFLARALCHEIDHLDGVLFIDRLHGLRRQLAMRRLRRLGFEVETARPGVAR